MKTKIRFFIGTLLVLFSGVFSGYSQVASDPGTTDPDAAKPKLPYVEHFTVRDGMVHFVAVHFLGGSPADSLRTLNLQGVVPGMNELPWVLRVDRGDSIRLYGEFSPNQDSMVFNVPVPMGIFQGWHHFELFYGGKSLFQIKKMLKSVNSLAGQQPSIESVMPRGSLPGSAFTVRGKNFGNDLNDIYIWFTDRHDDTLSAAISGLINPLTPSYLTTTGADGYQVIKFTVPGREVWDSINRALGDIDLLETELKMRVVVKGQPSANAPVLSVVKIFFRSRIMGILLLIYGFVFLVVWYLARRERKLGITRKYSLRSLIVDPDTNTLSLSRVQALAWTLVLMFSYSYFVIITFLVLDQSTIPDFDPSLLILMGISTSGLLIARGQEKATPAALLVKADKPSIWDLIEEGGKVSLASLQLALFTLVGLVMYLVYMTSPELVSTGLPTLPDTLLALMGISQGGFLTGKAVEISQRGNRLNEQAAQYPPPPTPPAANPVPPAQNPNPSAGPQNQNPEDSNPEQEPPVG